MAFKILSIDGGGIKGVFPASFLTTIEATLDRPLRDYFDLIAGTSTGGILALGLGLGYSAAELKNFYEEEGPEIFARGSSRFHSIRHLLRTKYRPQRLRQALEAKFSEKLLGHSKTRLIIPSMNAIDGRIHVFKTAHHERLKLDYKVKAVDVALATAAAPSYFPAHITYNVPMLDGGLWANNPTGLAAVEAVTILDQPRNELRILSLGCTDAPLNFEKSNAGKLGWAKTALDAASLGQSFGSVGTAYLIAGHENVLRCNPIVEPGRFALDRVSGIQALSGLGYSEAREALPNVTRMFFDKPVEPFTPMHSL